MLAGRHVKGCRGAACWVAHAAFGPNTYLDRQVGALAALQHRSTPLGKLKLTLTAGAIGDPILCRKLPGSSFNSHAWHLLRSPRAGWFSHQSDILPMVQTPRKKNPVAREVSQKLITRALFGAFQVRFHYDRAVHAFVADGFETPFSLFYPELVGAACRL